MAGFIAAQRVRYGIPHAVACRALGVSQAWFYKWCRGDVSLRRARRAAVDAAVAYEFARRQGRDGSPPITVRLRDTGWRISKNTVADSMRRQGLLARPKRKRRGLTRADRRARKPADRLRRDFAPPEQINQRWVSDLTEIPTGEGVLYLASILDLHSRRVVGYALGAHHDADLAAAAVQVAIAVRGSGVAGVVLHTDQGGEFSGGQLARVCATAGIIQSMGRTGSALDNAVAESFHSTLEFELRSRQRFATREAARRAVVEWIEEYNTDRLHSTNGMICPVDYEHGWRRPGAKTYDQLRRRRRGARTASTPVPDTGSALRANTTTEAAAPPLIFQGPMSVGLGQRRATLRDRPSASRALRVALRRPCGPPVDPEPPAVPTGRSKGQVTACPRNGAARHDRTHYQDQKTQNHMIEVSTVSGD